MITKNKGILSTTEWRKRALDIVEAGINKVLPTAILKASVKYDAPHRTVIINNDIFSVSDGRVFVIGGGKASGLMAEALEFIIPLEYITDGLINCKGGRYNTQKIKIIISGHPIPDHRGVQGVQEMLALKQHYSIRKNDLVICLISGGGSALMPYPVQGISLHDKQTITELLIHSGAEIAEINVVRKHLSGIKGGQLGAYFAPATVISLIVSDVIGNDLSTIASGPTYPDTSTFSDAIKVLKKYNLLSMVPEKITDFLRKGAGGEIDETPISLHNCYNYIIGDKRLALEAMRRKAHELGLTPFIITSEQKGDTNTVARSRAKEIMDDIYAGYNALLIGGETTLKLPLNPGRGGRNQHYAIVSMIAMEKYTGEWVVVSIGTDGSDFLPEVAGAIVDRSSLVNAGIKGLDVNNYIERCDSNTLLEHIGNSLVVTGDTGTNVGDVILYLYH